MNVLQESAKTWIPEGEKVAKVKLLEWVREIISVPTTEGVYGPGNPYRDAGVRKNYWHESGPL